MKLHIILAALAAVFIAGCGPICSDAPEARNAQGEVR